MIKGVEIKGVENYMPAILLNVCTTFSPVCTTCQSSSTEVPALSRWSATFYFIFSSATKCK